MENSEREATWDEIERLSKDPKTVEIALSREFFLRDQFQREEDAFNRGMKIGLEKVKEINLEKIVLSGHSLGISIDILTEITGFSNEKVRNIIESKDQ